MNWYNDKIRSEEIKIAQLHYCNWLSNLQNQIKVFNYENGLTKRLNLTTNIKLAGVQ